MSDAGALMGKRILYVEDDALTREAMSRFLRSRVGKIHLAASGEEGIEKNRELLPHIVIADLLMPGISGLEMIRAIKEENRSCRVLITSTVSAVNTVLEAVDAGIDHYIIKPVDTGELVAKLEKMAASIEESRRLSRIHRELAAGSMTGMLEDAIRREFLRLMKARMGKGPQDVRVVFLENSLEIIVLEAWNTMEKTIAENRRNLAMAEQYRKVYYEAVAAELEAGVGAILGTSVRLLSVQSDGQRRVDKLLLTIF